MEGRCHAPCSSLAGVTRQVSHALSRQVSHALSSRVSRALQFTETHLHPVEQGPWDGVQHVGSAHKQHLEAWGMCGHMALAYTGMTRTQCRWARLWHTRLGHSAGGHGSGTHD